MTSIIDRYEWKKIEVPKAWRPIDPGEELVGFFGGKTMRNGSHGQYEVVLVHVPRQGAFMVSGTKVIQLVDAANINIGWPIRIVWQGLIKLDVGRAMKNFEVLVAEGDPVSEINLPAIKPSWGTRL